MIWPSRSRKEFYDPREAAGCLGVSDHASHTLRILVHQSHSGR